MSEKLKLAPDGWKALSRLLDRVLELPPAERAGWPRLLAGLEAHRGARSAALGHLREAVSRGFSDTESLLEESDLGSLRGDPEFEEIAAVARANEEGKSPARK